MAAAALHRRVVGRVHQVDGYILRVSHVVGGVERPNVLVAGPDGVLPDVRARGVQAADGQLLHGPLAGGVVAAARVGAGVVGPAPCAAAAVDGAALARSVGGVKGGWRGEPPSGEVGGGATAVRGREDHVLAAAPVLGVAARRRRKKTSFLNMPNSIQV